MLLRVANYGIKDKYRGISDIALYLQSEVYVDDEGKAQEIGLDIAIDGVKQNDDYEDDKINEYKRSIKIDGDVKASLAVRPMKHFVKDL